MSSSLGLVSKGGIPNHLFWPLKLLKGITGLITAQGLKKVLSFVAVILFKR